MWANLNRGDLHYTKNFCLQGKGRMADLPVMKVILNPFRYRSVYRSSIGCSAGDMAGPRTLWSCMHAHLDHSQCKTEEKEGRNDGHELYRSS